MKRFILILSILLVVISTTACSAAEATDVSETEMVEEAVNEAVEDVEPTEKPQPTEDTEPTTSPEPVDYFEDKVSIDYATGFTVEYFDNYKVVTVLTPWDFAEETFTYVLVQEGTEEPEGFDGASFVTIPVETTVSMSTTFLPFLEMYGLLDTLVAVDDPTYVTNSVVLEMAKAGLPAVGTGPTVDVETLIALEPEVIFTNGYGFPDFDTHPVLIEAGLPVVINADYMDTNPLGRAEWGKFIAVFYNVEAIANEVFEETVANYENLKAMVTNVESKPTVFFNTPWEGTWYMPGGSSYMANFVEEAGGDYLWADDPSAGTLYLGFEDVIEKGAMEAEIWLAPGAFSFTAADVLAADERFEAFSAYQNGGLWNNNKILSPNFGNDFFESGVANPDLVLADLIYILHPEIMVQTNPDFATTYYQQLP
jgi:iron complex transport system substrate-binding protein